MTVTSQLSLPLHKD